MENSSNRFQKDSLMFAKHVNEFSNYMDFDCLTLMMRKMNLNSISKEAAGTIVTQMMNNFSFINNSYCFFSKSGIFFDIFWRICLVSIFLQLESSLRFNSFYCLSIKVHEHKTNNFISLFYRRKLSLNSTVVVNF